MSDTEETKTAEKAPKAKKPAKKEKKKAPKAKKAAKAGGAGKSVINREKYQYETRKVTGKDGKTKKVVDNADRVAVALSKLNIEDLGKVAKENGIEFNASKFTNPGLARMTLGNRLRGLVRDPKAKVTIGGQSVASLGG